MSDPQQPPSERPAKGNLRAIPPQAEPRSPMPDTLSSASQMPTVASSPYPPSPASSQSQAPPTPAYPSQNRSMPHYAPQNRPMPPTAPPPRYAQALPAQRASDSAAPRQRPNYILAGFKVLLYPFVKIVQMIGRLLTIILEEMVRSVVRFVLGVLVIGMFIGGIVLYGYALIQTNFDFVGAFPEMLTILRAFLGI